MPKSRSGTTFVGRLLRDQYDVALSLNGSDLSTVETAELIAKHLQRHGLKVFFYRDREEAEKSLGSDLQARLPAIYAERSKLVVLIASPNYSREGISKLEWEAIQRRQEQSPGEQFLICVSTVEADELPEGVRDRAFLRSGQPDGGEWPQPVVRPVLRRLGRWPLVKAALYYALLAAAILSLLLHWSRRTYLSPTAEVLTFVALGSAVVWWFVFRVVPRLRPSVVYAPRSLLASLYQRLYLNLFVERILFVAVLVTALLAHVTLPALESEMQDAMAGWLGSSPAERNAALFFFAQRVPQETAVTFWSAVLVNENRYGRGERGKALDMICRLLAAEEGQQPSTKNIAGRIRAYADDGNFGLNSDNWPSSLSGIDASGLHLDHTVFARMHFAGKDTSFAGADLKQSDLSATYWQAVDFGNADVRWSRFSLSTFLGIRGKTGPQGVVSTGAYFPGCTFFGCDLDESSFFAADLTGATFMSCSLTGVDFTNAHLTGVTFEDCDLTGASFTVDEVRWEDRWGKLAGVRFVRSRMRGAKFDGANFSGRVLPVYQSLAPDPSNLNAFTHFYTRDPELPATDREKEASIPVPPTVFIDCQIRDSGFADVQSAGLLMDRKTFIGLSSVEQTQLKEGGLDPEHLPQAVADQDDQTWEELKRDVLDPLFQAASAR